MERRRQCIGIDTAGALVYPEQVKFARLLTNRSFWNMSPILRWERVSVVPESRTKSRESCLYGMIVSLGA